MYKLDHSLKIKSEDLIYHMQEYDIDLLSNHIYLMGVDRGYDMTGIEEPGIEFVIAKRFIKNINICMRTNAGRPIIIHMKTSGGFWEEGMAIYDAIKSCPSKVTILNYTHARSMSSIIFQAADKRVMMPHSNFMFHDGSYAIEGTMKQVRSAIEFDNRNDNVMMDIYIEKMKENGLYKGATSQKIKKFLRDQMDKKEEVYLNAEDTVKMGLADEIFDYDWSGLSKY